jgi:hypothetical protein
VIIRNFPSDSQIPVGITTSYQGLSAKIYTDIVHAAAPHKPHKTAKAYLLLSSISPAIVGVIVAPLFAKKIDVVGRLRARSKKVGFFLLFLLIALLTGIYSVISSLGLTSRKLSHVAGAIVIAVFLLAPLLVPIIYLIGLNRLMKEEGEDDIETREVVPGGVMLLSRGFGCFFFFFFFVSFRRNSGHGVFEQLGTNSRILIRYIIGTRRGANRNTAITMAPATSNSFLDVKPKLLITE